MYDIFIRGTEITNCSKSFRVIHISFGREFSLVSFLCDIALSNLDSGSLFVSEVVRELFNERHISFEQLRYALNGRDGDTPQIDMKLTVQGEKYLKLGINSIGMFVNLR